MEALGINLPGLITQIISFLILLFVLSKLLYKPVIKMLDERAERIKTSLSAAEKANEDAALSAEKIEKELISARQEGQKIIDQAKKLSEESAELLIDYLNGTKKRTIEEASDLIYHLFVLLYSKKISLNDIKKELKKRNHVRRK